MVGFLKTDGKPIKMKCPNCNEVLVMAERQGVEIDYCPKCRGVWLDKGELDKIIVKSSDHETKYSRESDLSFSDRGKEQYKDYDKNYKEDPNYQRRKKKGFLGEFFDFD